MFLKQCIDEKKVSSCHLGAAAHSRMTPIMNINKLNSIYFNSSGRKLIPEYKMTMNSKNVHAGWVLGLHRAVAWHWQEQSPFIQRHPNMVTGKNLINLNSIFITTQFMWRIANSGKNNVNMVRTQNQKKNKKDIVSFFCSPTVNVVK